MIELNTLDDAVDGHQPRISYSCSCRKRSIVRTVLFVLTLLFIYDISLKLGLHFHVLVKIMRSQLTITKTTQHKHTTKNNTLFFSQESRVPNNQTTLPMSSTAKVVIHNEESSTTPLYNPPSIFTANPCHNNCGNHHITRNNILESLNSHSQVRREGKILITNLKAAIDELKQQNRSLAPGAVLAFSPHIATELESNIQTCCGQTQYPLARSEVMRVINKHTTYFLNDSSEIVVNMANVVSDLQSLDRPITNETFQPIGFQNEIADMLLQEIRCVPTFNPDVQVPMAPPTFPNATPPGFDFC